MISNRIIKISDFKLAALEWGKKKPTKILALHGWLDNANGFLPLKKELADFTVVALDLLGHGLSSHLPKGAVYHFIDSVTIIHAVLNALGWHRCILLGHSMGGGIATLAAGTFPERIEKLALIEALGPLSRPSHEIAESLMKHIQGVESLSRKRVPTYKKKEEAALARKMAGDLSLESARILCGRGLKRVGSRWTWRTDPRLRIDSPMRMNEEQVVAFLKKITCSTLLIEGQSASVFPPGVIESRKLHMGKLQSMTMQGGHHLHMENYDAVGRVLRAFFGDINKG